MSLFDSASLVITPNGVKEDKLYSIKPTDGSGDLVVTRATTATRVNSAGLIEVVPRNLLQYSEAISTSPWALVRSTVSTNSINSPTGTLTADTLVSNITGSNGSWTRQIVSAINGNFNMSIYAKQGTSPFLQVSLDGLGAVIFNLSNGTVKLSSSGIIGSITSVGSDGWYRCSISGTATGQTTALFIVGNSSMNLVTWFATNGDSVYLWGAQVEQGSLTEYFPTTDRLDVPRLDYTNSSCPSILVEPQRTNNFTYSEQFDNAYWVKYRLDLGTNTQVSPSGVQNADTFTSSAGQSFVPAIANTNITFLGNTRYSYSIYAKKIGTTDSFVLGYVDNSIGYTGGKASYNLTTQSITITQSPNASVTATMQSIGNGWYRLVLNFLTIAVPTYNYFEMNIPSTSVTNTFAIWGAQLELGANATSYIPTVASTVTRNADVISKTGISSLIGQTEGTIFAQINNTLTTYTGGYLIRLFADANNEIYIRKEGGTSTYSLVFRGNSVNIYVRTGINVLNGNNKIAFAYKSGDLAIYLNGVQIGTSTSTGGFSASVGNLDLGYFGTGFFNDRINSAILFKTRLTNAELATLTTI